MSEQPEALRLADYWKRRAAELQVWIDDGEGVEFGFRHEGLLKEQAKFLETADSFTALEQAGRQALKALEQIHPGNMTPMAEEAWNKAIAALRERLAQPEQEPVVWMYVNRSTHETIFQRHMRSFVDHGNWTETPLYSEPLANHELNCVCGAVWCGDEMVHLPHKSTPPQRKPLTDEQIRRIELTVHGYTRQRLDVKSFARAIEAAHGIGEKK